jgi:tetratricopeptide (TPR) repeat protein
MKKLFIRRSFHIVLLSLFAAASLVCSPQETGKIPITTDSREALADFKTGRDLFENLQAQESLKYFEQAIQKDPDFALAYVYYAQAQPTLKGFFEQINKVYSLKDKVSEGEKLWIEGLKAGADGFPMKQREFYQQMVQLFPNDERAHNLLATNYFATQEYQTAIEYYSKATTINPQFSQAYNQLGYAHRFLKNYNESEKAFQKYIELIPNDPNPYDSYAELLMKIGKYDQSIEQYKKALEINPNFVASHIGIATNLNFKEEHAKAREQLEALLNIARNVGEKRAARFAMTVSLIDEGMLDLAIEEMQKQYKLAEEINDYANMSGDLVFIGTILYEQGKYPEAKKYFNQALSVIESSDLSSEVKDNNRRGLLYQAARLAIAENDLTKAKSLTTELQKQAAIANNTFQLWLTHELSANIGMAEKRYSDAVKEYQQANLQNPYNLYRLALAYQAMGDKNSARDYCQQAAEHNTLNNPQYAFMRHKSNNLRTSM